MAKRILAFLLCVLMILPLLLACNDTQPPEHTHTYADAWSSSDDSHWKDATCGHEQKSEEGAHKFGDATLIEGELCSTCSVCGFVQKEIHAHEYGEWETVTAATIFAEGAQMRACKFVGCEASERRAIPAVAVASLSISTLPRKLHYYEDERLDVTDMVVHAVGADGSRTDVTALVSMDKQVLSDADTSVTVSYAGKNASFEIVVYTIAAHPHTYEGEWKIGTPATILAEGQKYRVCTFDGCQQREFARIDKIVVTALELVSPPEKLVYAVGEKLDADGMTVVAIGADGSRTDVTASVSYDDHALSLTDTAVTVRYADKNVSFEIAVYTFDTHPHNYVGEWKVATPATIFAEGQKYRVCTFQGCEQRELARMDKIAVTALELVTLPEKLTYTAGDMLDTAGMTVVAIGADASRTDVTALVSVDKQEISGADTIVTVSYDGKNTSFEIVIHTLDAHPHTYEGEWKIATPATILAEGRKYRVCTFDGCQQREYARIGKIAVTALELVNPPEKLTYTAGDMLDTAGMTVTAIGADASRADVTALVSVDKQVLSGADTTVTVSYGGKHVSFEIVVYTLDAHPHTYEGEWKVATPATILTEGQKYRACTFDGCRVRELERIDKIAVTALELVSPPENLIYAAGDKLDTDGMAVVAIGADASRTDVTALVSVDKQVLALTDTAVTLRFADKSVAFHVTVRAVKTVAQALTCSDGELVWAEGLFVGVADEIEGAQPALLLKDVQSDKLIAVQGVPYGSFPDYGYNKGDLVRLFATVVCESYDSSDTATENKVCLQFSDQNPDRADLTVRSCGNTVTYALDGAVELRSWNDVKKLFKPATLQAYTYVHFKGSVWFNSYYAANDGVPVYRFHMNEAATGLTAIKPDTKRCLTLKQNTLNANLPATLTSFFADYLGITTYPGAKANEIEFYAVVTATNPVNYQLVILDPSWLGGEKQKIEIKTQQDVVREVGYAYYRQGEQIHYDQRYRDDVIDPESATTQRQVYLDCSCYVNAVYYEAFGANILGVPVTQSSPSTDRYVKYAKNHRNDAKYPDAIGYWETDDYTEEAEQEALLAQISGMLQVGDVVVYRYGETSESSGHTLLYIGDGYFLHSTGRSGTHSYSSTTNKDVATSMELTHGTVQKVSAAELFTNKDSTMYLFYNSAERKMFKFCVLRPLARGLTVNEKTEKRMALAGLSFEKTVEPGLRAAVERGGQITYTLRIENHSSNVYENLPFKEILSEHLQFVRGSEGMVVSGREITASVSIGAMETVTLRWTAKVKADAPLGARIEGNATELNGFPLSTEANYVGKFTPEQLSAIASAALAAAESGKSYTDPILFANELYQGLLGEDLIKLQSAAELIEGSFSVWSASVTNYFKLNPDAPYIDITVPHLYNGDQIHRLETVTGLHRENNFMQGDLIFCKQGGSCYLFVYVGNRQFVRVTTSATSATVVANGKEFFRRAEDGTSYMNSLACRFRAFDFCLALRPTMAP